MADQAMKVVRLEGPPYEKIQCQLPKEELNPAGLGYKGYRENRSRMNSRNPGWCMRNAQWEIDGVKLCTQHAGMKALEHLTRENDQ